VYLVPHAETVAVRYDTSQGFLQTPSYEAFDIAQLFPPNDAGLPAFAGAAYDGRFIYYVPSTPGFGGVVRYDTSSDFTSACAWSTVDITQYNAAASYFWGAVYDGKYLYFVPRTGSTVARFDTKTARSMPSLPAFSGSFY
jgi:hypothetical protein